MQPLVTDSPESNICVRKEDLGDHNLAEGVPITANPVHNSAHVNDSNCDNEKPATIPAKGAYDLGGSFMSVIKACADCYSGEEDMKKHAPATALKGDLCCGLIPTLRWRWRDEGGDATPSKGGDARQQVPPADDACSSILKL